MITKELLDYIKTQLAAGVPKESIIQNLSTTGGWNANNINEAFASLGSLPTEQSVHATENGVGENKFWTKHVQRSNNSTLYFTLGMLLTVDLVILILSPGLFPFWIAMAAVVAGLYGFIYFENHYLGPKFQHTDSKLDYWILTMVGIRNLVAAINVIPVIQLIGMAALTFLALPYLVVYSLLIYFRFKNLPGTSV